MEATIPFALFANLPEPKRREADIIERAHSIVHKNQEDHQSLGI